MGGISQVFNQSKKKIKKNVWNYKKLVLDLQCISIVVH